MTNLEVIVSVEIGGENSNEIAYKVLKAIQRRYVIIELEEWNRIIEASSIVNTVVDEQESYRLAELEVEWEDEDE